MPTINYNAALPAFSSISGRSSIDINKWVSELKFNISSLIKSLFANNEQGFFYDPNDLSTMFQDAAGTVPVTGVGQPVGLILDKSKGLVLSGELVAPLNFNDGWVVASSTITSANSFSVPSFQGGVRKAIFEIGKSYKISVSYTSSQSEVGLELRNGTTAGGALISKGVGLLATVTGHLINATNTSLYLRTTNPTDISITSISVKELAGNHAYQTTSASRPILHQNATTGAYYLEFDGSDDFLVTNSIDFTITDKVSLFAGVRKLQDIIGSVVVELGVSSTNTGSFRIYAGAGSATGPYWTFISRGSVSSIATSPATYPAPISSVLTCKSDLTTSIITLDVDGVEVARNLTGQNAINYNNYPLYIGRRGGTTLPYNGHIYGLIGVGKLTSANETAAIEKELAKRTGVTLS